jgi:ATP-dependent DNA ligase
VLFASDLIEHDGDLRDLPLIDRKRRLAKLIGKAKRRARHARQKNWSLRNMPGALSVRARARIPS